jgi:hypothetical protein
MTTIYKERANGRWEYWTYVDHARIYLSEKTANKEIKRGAILKEIA